MPNRLAGTPSRYLLQHQNNPIDWFPWGEEAWDKARSLNRPVFLSIGYSSCHWCHVMAHESFEDQETADFLNQNFISIKVDREERPDIDDYYMTAVQLANGHGGWPMTLILTPEQKPFFAGTYFPKVARGDFPSFLTLMSSLSRAWKENQSEVLHAAEEFFQGISAALERTLPSHSADWSVATLDNAIHELHEHFDFEHGGFGHEPKFPPHAAIKFLLNYAKIRFELPNPNEDTIAAAQHMALFTLLNMANGGIWDHVGGGFHRYSTDAAWHLPHFEKMLSDNALMLRNYSLAVEIAEEGAPKRILQRIRDQLIEWILGQMKMSNLALASSVNADSDGEEGLYYLWTLGEVSEIVRQPNFISDFGIESEGNYLDESRKIRTGLNVLQQLSGFEYDYSLELQRLREVRALRNAPSVDDKCIASWNGFAISSLVCAGKIADAIQIAKIWKRSLPELPHMICGDQKIGEAFLEDIAALAIAFADLYEATNDDMWRASAETLGDQLTSNFGELSSGLTSGKLTSDFRLGFSRSFLDSATPSGNALAIEALRKTGRIFEAKTLLRAGLGWMKAAPRATESLLSELLMLLRNTDHQETDENEPESEKTLTIRFVPQELKLDDEGWAYSDLEIIIPPFSHINTNDPIADWLFPLTLEADGAFAEASYPESQSGSYSGQVLIPIRLRPKGNQKSVSLTVRYQLCTDSECFLPTSLVATAEFK